LAGFEGKASLFRLFELLESLVSLSLLSFFIDGAMAFFLGKLGVNG
jgi:hypothetical protein